MGSRSLAGVSRFAAVVFAAGILVGCNTSNSYFYEEKGPQKDESIGLLGAFLEGSGVVPRQQASIDYEARSPITVPPTTELPQPEPEGGSALASVDWPDDPDKDKSSASLAANGGVYEDPLSGERLTPEQIQAGRIEGGLPGQKPKDPSYMERDSGGAGKRLTPAEMKKTFDSPDSKKSGRILTAEGGAQPRQYLIQPPDEYRQPAATAALPDESDIEESAWYKKQLYGEKKNANPVYDTVK